MPNFYLGTDTVDSIYLGDQNVCDSYVGPTQAFDNCTYTPVVVTLNVSDQISGSQYSITGDSTGASRSGQAGVDTYSFTTGVSAYSGHTYSGNAPVTTSGTFPSSNTTVTSTLTGSVTQDTVPSSTINYVATTGLSGASASVSPSSRLGTPGNTDNQNIIVSFGGSSDFTYTNLSVGGVSFSYGSDATFSPGATFPADGTSTTSSWSVTGTATANTYTYTLYWEALGSNYTVTTPDGTTASAPTSGSVSVSGTAGTTSSISISASAVPGYALYSSSSAGASVTHSSSNNGGDNQSSPASLNPQAYLIYNDISATGPYTQYSDAANCLNYNTACAGGLSVWYQGGSSGVLGSGPYFTSFSGAPPSPSGALPNGYYIDEDASPRTIFS